jgi:hypothetical protein
MNTAMKRVIEILMGGRLFPFLSLPSRIFARTHLKVEKARRSKGKRRQS